VEGGELCERKNGRGVDPNRNWKVHWGFKEKGEGPSTQVPVVDLPIMGGSAGGGSVGSLVAAAAPEIVELSFLFEACILHSTYAALTSTCPIKRPLLHSRHLTQTNPCAPACPCPACRPSEPCLPPL
jgi:hypothetical protein